VPGDPTLLPGQKAGRRRFNRCEFTLQIVFRTNNSGTWTLVPCLYSVLDVVLRTTCSTIGVWFSGQKSHVLR